MSIWTIAIDPRPEGVDGPLVGLNVHIGNVRDWVFGQLIVNMKARVPAYGKVSFDFQLDLLSPRDPELITKITSIQVNDMCDLPINFPPSGCAIIPT
jgi:hypothetical protein